MNFSDSSPCPLHGRIDIHSHLLPHVDDGCQSVTDSLACIIELQEQGFIGTICTPHIMSDAFPANTVDNIARWVSELQEAIAEAGLIYHLWPGGEVRIAEDTFDWLQKNGVPTLGASRAVLIDWWGGDWPRFADVLIEQLQGDGYQPILAHPERMGLPLDLLEKVVRKLLDQGVWLQGNYNSLSGGEGAQAERLSQLWLEEGVYHLLATDMHRPNQLFGRFLGIDSVEERLGADIHRIYLEQRPREILGL